MMIYAICSVLILLTDWPRRLSPKWPILC